MGRLKKRKTKRQTLKLKYKIQRKVKEHNRKVKKEAKLNPKPKTKKDPGIPNLYPFKDELLRKIEEHRERVEAEKLARKDQRKETRRLRKEEHEKEKKTIQQLIADATRKSKVFDFKEKTALEALNGSGSVKDSSRRAYFKEFKKVVKASDVILQVLDARDPLGCRCIEIEQMILSKDANKRIVLILNKIDLVPKEIVEKWLKYLRNFYPTIAFKSSTQAQRKHLGHSHASVSADINTSECLGADTLIKLLKNYANNKGLKTTITVGIVGYPNVGKSSLINSLKRERAVGVGSTPGFTKTAQEVHLDKHIKLLDTPGIVFAADSSNPDVILRNCVKIEQIEDPIAPIESILKRCRKQQLLLIYKIPLYENATEFLAHIALKYGKLSKGGVPDYSAAARVVLQDWNGGKIPYFIQPPEMSDVHVDAQVVQNYSKEFNVEEDDQKIISTLKPLSDKFMEVEQSATTNTAFFASLDDNEEEEDDAMEEGDDDDEEDDAEDMEDDDEDEEFVTSASSSSTSKKQNLRDAEDQFNLQLNKNLHKKQKQLKKKEKKAQKKSQAVEDYDFSTDFPDEDE